ncbi:hypothetical protein BASA50_003130 [Batrachochytrium salamandrivorans]|uniref:HTH CENPB-type domain-containing protein n=1 Tax=Batrachochytrium salamandrivorans TaxID=1357716 RepID=A0ABQ8FKK0_9FUNG|nr:hypothetical protein BASA50_003130 [Batrachochytrium salamandrivorans]
MSIVEPEKKRRKLVDLSTKLAILKYLDDNHSIRATADKFKGKAKQIATQIGVGVDEFSALEGWFQKWKKRNNVRSYKISGESGNMDLTGAEQWKSSLTTMFTGYDLRNVFNMDETGFFF